MREVFGHPQSHWLQDPEHTGKQPGKANSQELLTLAPVPAYSTPAPPTVLAPSLASQLLSTAVEAA